MKDVKHIPFLIYAFFMCVILVSINLFTMIGGKLFSIVSIAMFDLGAWSANKIGEIVVKGDKKFGVNHGE